MRNYTIKDRILDRRNIFSAIFCLESYVFDKGLLDTDIPIAITDKNNHILEVIAKNDLELYYALSDKHNIILIEKVIELCIARLNCLFNNKDELFLIKVFFKLKSYDSGVLKFRPLHTARLIDLICMVSILIPLMYDDDYEKGHVHFLICQSWFLTIFMVMYLALTFNTCFISGRQNIRNIQMT